VRVIQSDQTELFVLCRDNAIVRARSCWWVPTQQASSAIAGTSLMSMLSGRVSTRIRGWMLLHSVGLVGYCSGVSTATAGQAPPGPLSGA